MQIRILVVHIMLAVDIRALGPKYHSDYSIWALNPKIFGSLDPYSIEHGQTELPVGCGVSDLVSTMQKVLE